MSTTLSTRPPTTDRAIDARFTESLPRLSLLERLTLRLCLATIQRIAERPSRAERIRAHQLALAVERRASQAERLALLTLPRR